MRLFLTGEERTFRDEIHRFVAEELPDTVRGKVARGEYLAKSEQVEWQKALYRRGWIAPAWPKQYGGAGWPAARRCLFKNELEIAGAPLPVPYGVDMIGPVIYTHGTLEQQERFLQPILKSDIWWCQGFSEPNAGSDLASLRTAAADHGDHYRVTGQKIWTSKARYADWMFLLARTRVAERRQDGLSMLLLNMSAPGVSVRSIRSIDGDESLAEVFLDDVLVPKCDLIGEDGQGWSYAKFLLGHERTAVAGVGRLWGRFERVRKAIRVYRAEWPDIACADMLCELARIEADLVALSYFELKAVAGGLSGQARDAAPSLLKIAGTELQQRLTDFSVQMLGSYGALVQGHDAPLSSGPPFGAGWVRQHLYARAASIYGGTNEIQRDIIAKLMLD